MMLPEGWKETTLGNISEKIQTGPFGSQLHASDYTPFGIAVVMPKDLEGCQVNINTSAKISELKANSLKKHTLSIGDILFSRRGDVSRFAVIDKKAEGSLCGTGCLLVRLSPDNSSNFYKFFLQTVSVITWLEDSAVGQTMPNMNATILSALPLLIPPLPEQEKIAEILTSWDKAITITDQLLENSRQQKKALIQQLLTGKKRLPGFSGEWEKKKLKDISDITMGVSPKSHNYNTENKGIPLIQGNTDIKNRKSFPRVYTTQIIKKCSYGDILFSVRAPVGYVALSEHVACIGRGIASIATQANYDNYFLFQYFLLIENNWNSISQGSTFESITSTQLNQLPISLPPLPEQQAIAAVLTAADREIELLEQKAARLRDEKKALMQQLLTGKRRVNVA